MLGILGAGSWGTALAFQATRGGRRSLLWECRLSAAQQLRESRQNRRFLPGISLPDSLQITSDLQQCVGQCDTLLVVVPSIAFRNVLEQLRPIISSEQGLAWATKGLDQKNGHLLYQVAHTILGKDFPLAVLSGPSFALEVARQKPTAVNLASTDRNLANRLVNYMHGDTFRIYTSHDLAGVCLGGAYKNILAIAAGIADGLELGDNARAALITRGLAEMQRLGLALGGHAETFMGLAGLGDLVLTCTGDLSRNRQLGMALAGGGDLDTIQTGIGQVTEGVETARAMRKLAQTTGTDLPIAEEVYRVLFQGRSPGQAVHALLSREPGREF